MSNVAVPNVIQSQLHEATLHVPPGHRFLLYLPMWKADWGIDQDAKSQAARKSTNIPDATQKQVQALRARQLALGSECGAFTRKVKSTSPLATGLGNEHPSENGFAFLTPYGMPYLAGSGIKGVLRRAMQELRIDHVADCDDAAIEALFGAEDVNKPEDAWRGALDVWDCFPQCAENKMVVEIMTPHYSDYYSGSSTPHDAGKPNPIPFLAVPAGSEFHFHVLCHETRLPLDMRGARWKCLLNKAFDHAFSWVGFGAKTAVGYGAMEESEEQKKERVDEEKAQDAKEKKNAEDKRVAGLKPADRERENAQIAMDAFRKQFAAAKSAPFSPGGAFNASRQVFMQTALSWIDQEYRAAAGTLLAETATKQWGRPSKKERWEEIQQAIVSLTNHIPN